MDFLLILLLLCTYCKSFVSPWVLICNWLSPFLRNWCNALVLFRVNISSLYRWNTHLQIRIESTFLLEWHTLACSIHAIHERDLDIQIDILATLLFLALFPHIEERCEITKNWFIESSHTSTSWFLLPLSEEIFIVCKRISASLPLRLLVACQAWLIINLSLAIIRQGFIGTSYIIRLLLIDFSEFLFGIGRWVFIRMVLLC